MASPRPMLVISETNDWSPTVPAIEFPYLKKIYSLYGKPENVENVHIENEEHNYGQLLSTKKQSYALSIIFVINYFFHLVIGGQTMIKLNILNLQ